MKTPTPNLRTIREQQVLTQAMLAQRVGVRSMTISRLERGGDAYPATVRKIAFALGVEPGMLTRKGRAR